MFLQPKDVSIQVPKYSISDKIPAVPSNRTKCPTNQTDDPTTTISSVCNRRLHYFPNNSKINNNIIDKERQSLSHKDPLYVPSSIRCPQIQDPFGRDGVSPLHSWSFSSAYCMRFAWLEQQQKNNNSGESSSRKVAAKEMSRREVENWYYMHFRFRMDGYQSLVYAVKQSVKEESIFSEEHIDKWTMKLRFRIRRSSPLKNALVACASRLGLDYNPDVMFCIDGFYGDAVTGRIHNKNETPNRIVQPTSTCRAMGLCNGSCLFVSRATKSERVNASIQMQLDLLRNLETDGSDSDSGTSLFLNSRISASITDVAAMRASLLANKEECATGLESLDFRQADGRQFGFSGIYSVSEFSSNDDNFGRYSGSSKRK